MSALIDALVALLALPWLVATGYLFTLTLASRRRAAPAPGPRTLTFEVVVPAHDEEAGIADTVRSLLALDWPKELLRIIVVADNCADETAARAREAGAEVIVRTDAERRGKGYALQLAFERGLAEGRAAAFVVIDADTVVTANLLEAFAARLATGALVVQADYAVRNPDAGWRTRLMRIALGMFHVLRSLGRETLGVSCGLRGNGMCFSAELLRRVPHEAFSLVEDLEYGIRVGLAGERVWYAGEAHVYGEMVAGAKASQSQRQRWEGGRFEMARRHGLPLLGRAFTERSGLLLDLALDVLVPPLSTVAMAIVSGLALSIALALFGRAGVALAAWSVCAAFLAAYVARGWALSETGLRGLLDLAFAPLYMVWKLTLSVRGTRPRDWVRTSRERKP